MPRNINVYWRDDYVLGEANGTIHWDQPWTWSFFGEKSFNPAEHVHVVDGGSTAAPSLVVLQGSSSDYRFTTKMTDLGLEADLNWVDSDSVEHLIGHLYRTKPLLFLPTTTSSSAAGADTMSAAEPQFMVNLDGSAVTVQTALAGQAALTVDPSFDYTDAGDENFTITGSGLGDIIALGSGNNTVIETTGNNIIFVKDASTAGSNTIHGGDGYDTIVGGQGNDTIVGGSGITTVYYSGARSEYQITRLENGALQIADPGTGTPEGTDTLSGVEFFRFADKTYSFSAPVIAATDVAAVYGQTFAASDLFAAVDSDGPILSYQLLDSTPDPTSGKWLLGGAAQTASQIIDVSAAQLAQTEFQSGFGTDSLSVRAFDGIDWSEWTPLTVASHPTSLLIGVNLAGAEFAPPYDTNTGQPHIENPNPGVFGTDYTYPTHVEIDYYAAKGMSVVRLPFLWERIQHTQFGPLDAAELGRLDDVVNYATGKGLKIEIEPHNYGFGFGSLIGSAQTPNSSFADLWGKLAVHYKSNPDVIFGLMNEPHVQTATEWLGSANAAIAAIRSAGAMQEILVPGSRLGRSLELDLGGLEQCHRDRPGVLDPGHNFAFEVHQYLDSDSSGTHPGVVSPTIGVERLTAITQWAEANSQRLFLGEVGVDTQPTSLQALDNMLSYIKQHTDVWSGVTYWAGGPWWGNYMFSIEPQNVNDPNNYGDKPQMAILMARGADTAAASILENTTAVTTVMATDPDTGQTLSYSISGGADAGKFTIGSSTGALSFITAPNFELPTDAGGNNVYDVTVQVSDGHGGIDTQAIAVTGSECPRRRVRPERQRPGRDLDHGRHEPDRRGDGRAEPRTVVACQRRCRLQRRRQGRHSLAERQRPGAIWTMDGMNLTGGGDGRSEPRTVVACQRRCRLQRRRQGRHSLAERQRPGAIWTMDGMNLTGAGDGRPNPGPSWHVKDAADFNGDGKADILWQNDSGQAAIWTMDGMNLTGAATVGPTPDRRGMSKTLPTSTATARPTFFGRTTAARLRSGPWTA